MYKILRQLRYFIRRRALRFRLLFVRKDTQAKFRSMLIIAPHPDDEIIGLGGYMVRQAAAGCSIAIVYLTDGEKSLEDVEPEIVAGHRRRLSLEVHQQLDVLPVRVSWLHFPDGSIPRKGHEAFEGAAEQVADIIRRINPDAVFVTHPMDTWPFDHIAAYEIAAAALTKAASGCAFFGYWVWLWYSMPTPAMFRMRWRNMSRIPLDGVMQRKNMLMEVYLQPEAPNGKPWSGVLPKAMTDAFRYPYEVVEEF